MEGQTTEAVQEETQTEVHPEQTVYENIADGILSEDVEEVQEEPKEEPKEEPEVRTFKVKVDGEESEVDEQTLISGYQYAAHNTKKAQALADKERELAAMEGLANKLRTDAEFHKHVFSYGEQPQEELNPVEQLTKDVTEKATAAVDEKLKEEQNRQLMQHIQKVKTEVQQDPDYQAVQEKILEHVKNTPEHLRQIEAQKLHLDPTYYLKKFNEIKKGLKPETVKPPVLVDSGQTNDVPENVSNQSKRKKMKADMLKSGNLSNLQDYFKMPGGIADQLS